MTAPEQVGGRGVSVVIPCLNEESSIAAVIADAREGIAALGLPGEVIVVDNRSTDRSAEIAREQGARVLREEIPGYGAALRRGFAAARFDVLVMGDADQTYDFTRLGELARPILEGQADFVIGNRMGNIRPGSMPWLHRYVGNPIMSMLLRLMFPGARVRDTQCGLRAIAREAYLRLHCVTTGMEFASEMIVRALHQRLRMAERDIIYHARVGDSKLRSFRDGWRHLRFMMLHSPTMLLLVPGLMGWIAGLAITLPLVLGPVYFHGRAIDVHCMLVGGLLNVISIQVITIGLLAKAYAHLSGLREDTVIAWLYRRLTFETAVLISLPLLLLGAGLVVFVTAKWVASGFGALNETRALFFALLCLVNGVQIATAAYLFSIMALPRRLEPPSQSDDD